MDKGRDREKGERKRERGIERDRRGGVESERDTYLKSRSGGIWIDRIY